MPDCVICGGTDFYAEAGFYFCKECQTQSQDIREEVLELKVDPTTRVRKIHIRQDKSSATGQNLGWTTWEQYNFILIGLTNELIDLGASADIKLTVLQLWAFYLKKIEVAFISTTRKTVPKLARKYHKRDAEIIYGKVIERKRTRKRGTNSNASAPSMISDVQDEGNSTRDRSKQKKRMVAAEYERFMQSQESSDGETLSIMNQSLFSVGSSSGKSSNRTENTIRFNKAARKESQKIKVLSKKLARVERSKYHRKHSTTQYTAGPQVLTPMKLWSLIYLALRIHDEDIHLADMLRYAREGHFSYYQLDHLLPPEVTLSRKEVNMLRLTREISHKGMRQSVCSMAKFLKVWETKKPHMLTLVERYCVELQLPRGIALYAERMMAMSPPKMTFNANSSYFPNYEGRAMAFIIVVMKILFAIDDQTEYEISRVTEKINRIASKNGTLESRLFSFYEWQRYLECRRNLLTNLHFPTRMRRDPEADGNSHLYLRFLAAMRSKCSDREEAIVTSYKHLIPQELAGAMKKIIEKLENSGNSVQREVDIFPPSSTPHYSYLRQLLRDPEKDLPSILRMDFHSMKIGYMTKPKSLQALASRCKIDLEIVDTGIHFLEKIVRTYEQSDLPNVQEFNKIVRVEQPANTKSACDTSRRLCENPEEYQHRKHPGIFFIDSSKRNEYDSARRASTQFSTDPTKEHDDFGFDEVYSNGKLYIRNDDDSDDDSVSLKINENSDESRRNSSDPFHSSNNFLSKYNLSLSNVEKISLAKTLEGDSTSIRLSKPKQKVIRDPLTGKFVSANKVIETRKSVLSKCRDKRKSTLCENDEPVISKNSSKTYESFAVVENDESAQTSVLDSSFDFNLNDDDISVLQETSFDSIDDDVEENDSSTSDRESETLFRPYNDYWMLRCNFSRVKQKNFRKLEKNLPNNFRWLLEECSNVIEITEEELYEEVCLVEMYYSDILGPSDNPLQNCRYDNEEYRSKAHCNLIRKKW